MNETEWEMLIDDVRSILNFHSADGVKKCESNPWSKIAQVPLPTGLFVEGILETNDRLVDHGYFATLSIEDESVVMYIHVRREAFVRVVHGGEVDR